MEKEYRAVEAPVVPHIKATQDRVTLEIQRGCIRGCRFCQAGMIYRPTRERDVETLKESARIMLKNTGHEEISLRERVLALLFAISSMPKAVMVSCAFCLLWLLVSP